MWRQSNEKKMVDGVREKPLINESKSNIGLALSFPDICARILVGKKAYSSQGKVNQFFFTALSYWRRHLADRILIRQTTMGGQQHVRNLCTLNMHVV